MKHLLLKSRQNASTILLFLVIAVFYLKFGCPFRLLTGISCPGCGLTRALSALLKLDFTLAYEMHPLVFLLPLAVLIFFLRKLVPKRMMITLCAFALILLLAVYVTRMSQQGSVVYASPESGLIYKIFDF